MKVIVGLVWMCLWMGAECFIIPDELPSLLSVIYSNIPTIKKGTDSRVGWGFRLGDRADFQFMVELGPQTNTQPLANQGGSDGNSKRNALENLANVLYAQRELQKKQKEPAKEKDEKKVISAPNSDGAQWLKNWSKTVSSHQQEPVPVPPLPSNAKPGLGIGEIDAKSVIPEDTDDEEKEEKRKILEAMVLPSTGKPRTTTSKEDALDNVDLD